jgi:hypothetical protein
MRVHSPPRDFKNNIDEGSLNFYVPCALFPNSGQDQLIHPQIEILETCLKINCLPLFSLRPSADGLNPKPNQPNLNQQQQLPH